MKPEIAEKWIKALRSGDYIQGKDKLKNNIFFCCLGVLCEIAVKEGIIEPSIDGIDEYGGRSSYPPFEVYSSWAGMNNKYGNINCIGISLPVLNDSGNMSFEQIADIVEANVENI